METACTRLKMNYFLFFLFFILSWFNKDYFCRIVYAGMKLLLYALNKVPWIAFMSYFMILIFSITLVSIKVFLTITMIVGNIIDVYIYGMIAVLISILLYLWFFGLVVLGFLLFLFLSSLTSFLFVILLLELFSIFFQSITLTNRISINILCGSLLLSLLSLFVFFNYFLFCIIFMIFGFELFNSMIQLFIFSMLSYEYILL